MTNHLHCPGLDSPGMFAMPPAPSDDGCTTSQTCAIQKTKYRADNDVVKKNGSRDFKAVLGGLHISLA